MSAEYEREVHLSAPLSPNSQLAAETHNGSITVVGGDTVECSLTATIKSRAATEEQAQKLAEQTKVELLPQDNTLKVKISRPLLISNQSVGVSLDMRIPNQTDLVLTTHNGAVKIENVTGKVDAKTHNGKATASQVCGNMKLHTHNGSVSCRRISGDADASSYNGGIDVSYAESASSVCNISLATHNGGVDLTCPPEFSAHAEISTHNGSIRTDLPITVTGKLDKKKITGTIGTGQGKLYIKTYNGSVHVR
jgi:hypothetical protein